MIYNATPHNVTGYPPYFLEHGRAPRLPFVDGQPETELQPNYTDYPTYVERTLRGLQLAYNEAYKTQKHHQALSDKYYNQRRGNFHRKFRVGDRVWRDSIPASQGPEHKFAKPFTGPYYIVSLDDKKGARMEPSTARIRLLHHDDGKTTIVPVDQLRIVFDGIEHNRYWDGKTYKDVPEIYPEGQQPQPQQGNPQQVRMTIACTKDGREFTLRSARPTQSEKLPPQPTPVDTRQDRWMRQRLERQHEWTEQFQWWTEEENGQDPRSSLGLRSDRNEEAWRQGVVASLPGERQTVYQE
jgi:hypothetical protein